MENTTASMIIDGRSYPINGEKNVLQLCRNNGIDIPSLCYHPSLSIFGACRMCLVECEGLGIVSSCTLAPRDGMVIKTNTDAIRNMRKHTGAPICDLIKMATATPAKAIGIYGDRGSIEPGKVADLVVLDEDLNVKGVILEGNFVRKDF